MHKLVIPMAAAGVLTLGIGLAWSAAPNDNSGPAGKSTSGTYGTSGSNDLSGTKSTANTSTTGTSGGNWGAGTGTTGTTEPIGRGGGPATGSTTGTTTGTTSGTTGSGKMGMAQNCPMDDEAKTIAVLQFLHEANQSEIKEGNLASMRASSSDVKSYASDLVKEHTDADNKLTDLAKKKSYSLARTTPNDPIHAAVISASDANDTMLGSKTGKSFDTAFISPEVSEHTLAIKVVDEGLKSAKDQDVKKLLTEVRASLMKHQQHAAKLQDQLAMGTSPTTGTGVGGGPKSTSPGSSNTGEINQKGDSSGK